MEANRAYARSADNLSRYACAASGYPILSADVEQALCVRWRDQQDVAAVHELVASHLRLVIKLARAYRGYGLPMEDLVGEGQLGLMRAVAKFDLDHGVRFATYAVWWIRSEMQAYILRNWSLVKLGTTTSQKKLFFNLRRTCHAMQISTVEGLKSEHAARIAVALQVSEDEVMQMDQRMSFPDLSLNVRIDADDQRDWQSQLVDDREGQEDILSATEEIGQRRALLRSALGKLSPREQHIITARHLQETPASLAELSQHHHISRERVRQIENRAIAKLEQSVQSSVAKRGDA